MFVKPVVHPGLTTVLNEQLFVQHGCQTGCQTRLTTGLTTGWMFVYTIQPVVKPVVQPVSQPVVSCKRVFKIVRRIWEVGMAGSPVTGRRREAFSTLLRRPGLRARTGGVLAI